MYSRLTGAKTGKKESAGSVHTNSVLMNVLQAEENFILWCASVSSREASFLKKTGYN